MNLLYKGYIRLQIQYNLIISINTGNPNFMEGSDMTEIEFLLEDIEKPRKNLNDLIAAKNSNLSDPDIIAASQILNAAISKLNELIENRKT